MPIASLNDELDTATLRRMDKIGWLNAWRVRCEAAEYTYFIAITYEAAGLPHLADRMRRLAGMKPIHDTERAFRGGMRPQKIHTENKARLLAIIRERGEVTGCELWRIVQKWNVSRGTFDGYLAQLRGADIRSIPIGGVNVKYVPA